MRPEANLLRAAGAEDAAAGARYEAMRLHPELSSLYSRTLAELLSGRPGPSLERVERAALRAAATGGAR